MQSQNNNSPLIVVVNSTGQQSSPVVHAASAAGFCVRAQVRSVSKPEAKALQALPNVTLVEGSIEDTSFVNNTLFKDADYAWVNTTYLQKDETELGKTLALAAKNAGVKHYIYSSLPDHSKINNGTWKFPPWAAKYAVEEYIRTLDNFSATFVYVGLYLENFSQKDSPSGKLKRQEDGSILISGMVAPHIKFEVIDVERDLGPAIVTILKQGPAKWNQKRIALAFENVSMEEIAKRFSDATGIKVTYENTLVVPAELSGVDTALEIMNKGVHFDFDCKVPDQGKELNPNWHSVEDFAKNKWKKPEA